MAQSASRRPPSRRDYRQAALVLTRKLTVAGRPCRSRCCGTATRASDVVEERGRSALTLGTPVEPCGQETVAFNYASLRVREVSVLKNQLLGASDNLHRDAPNQMLVAKARECMEEVTARRDPS